MNRTQNKSVYKIQKRPNAYDKYWILLGEILYLYDYNFYPVKLRLLQAYMPNQPFSLSQHGSNRNIIVSSTKRIHRNNISQE